MNSSCRLWVTVPLLLLCACSGGGGGSPTFISTAWEKFRRDTSNSGAAIGAIALNNGVSKQSVPIDAPPAAPGAISSSPAIAQDGTVYIGSEGGTLAAFDANLNLKWRKSSCEACPADSQDLGVLRSSPAIFTLNGQTNIFIGSSALGTKPGSVFGFQDSGSGEPSCTMCFRPSVERDFGSGSGLTITAASFASSPSFTTDPVLFTVNGVFIGADLEVQQTGSTQHLGKLYALNNDGSVRWQFPRRNELVIGAVTSSAGLGSGTWYFTSADGYLYALGFDGSLKWKSPLGPTPGPTPGSTPPFAPAVLTAGSYIVSPTGNGAILAISPDQLVSFRVNVAVGASLAFGGLFEITPTPTPAPAASPTPPPGATQTATVTPTPGIPSFVYGVTQSGQVVGFNELQPIPTFFPTPPTPIATPVISSPALSSDGFLVFGASDGRLHAVSTTDGSEPPGWPIQIAALAIRSSPSLAENGTIYVGADDGMLYAVGLQ